MDTLDTSSLSRTSAPIGAAPAATPDAAKLRLLAGQFEAQMLSHLMKEMRDSSLDDGEKTGFDAGPLGDMINSELGLALSRAGGFGLGDVLGRALGRQNAAQSAPLGQQPASNTVAMPVASAQTPDPTPVVAANDSAVDGWAPPGRVTSAFGWRRDPIDGAERFHNGTDIAMPVGTPVASAGDGRVTFVGERPGYGLTVEVVHADGMQTRYAHLSTASVQPGEAVQKGQSIARSGNSGRSTGPHLHFEVLQNGQSVDPQNLQ